MLKKLTLIAVMLVSTNVLAKAQIKKEQLIGNWKLVELIDKNISENEKLKRYTFTTDSLIYSSPRRNVKGSYKLAPQTGLLNWYATGTESAITLTIKYIDTNTIHMGQAGGATGVLKRSN